MRDVSTGLAEPVLQAKISFVYIAMTTNSSL